MKISYNKQGSSFNAVSENGKVKIENLSCAVEWNSEDGVLKRFSGFDADSVSKKADNIIFSKKDCPEMLWNITKESGNLIITLSIKNTCSENIKLKRLLPFFIEQSQKGKIDLNGIASCQVRFLPIRRLCCDIVPQYVFEKLYMQDSFSSEMMTSVYDVSTAYALNIGFISTADMFGKITFSFDPFKRLNEFAAFCNAEGIMLEPGQKVVSEKLYVNIDSGAQNGLKEYTSRIQKEMKCNITHKPVAGWGTWDFYFGDISEKSILENVEFMKVHRDELPVEYIQIDAGYTFARDFEWLKWNENFPHGPAWLVKQINAKGFKAGLWLVPFWSCKNTEFTRTHQDWLVKEKDGNPVAPWENMFVLDGSHPDVQKHLANLAKTLTQEYGFEYIKIDGASMTGMVEGVHYDPKLTSCQAYRKGIEAFRKGMKKGTVFMGGIYAPGIGLVDAMRVGNDVGARWDSSKTNVHLGERDRYHGSGNVKRSIASTLNSMFMHNRIWAVDGDYLVVRDDRSELTLGEARLWATVTGLAGGTALVSDRMETLSKTRLEILKKIFPLCGTTIEPLDFLKKDIPEILHTHIETASESWELVTLCNYSESKDMKTVTFADIGLDKSEEYHAFGFWKSKYFGLFMNSVSVALEPHSCEVVILRKNKKLPQVLATDIHITGGKLEIVSSEFKNNTLEIKLANAKKSGNIFIYVPDAFEPDGTELVKLPLTANVWKAQISLDGKTVKYVFKKIKKA